VEFGAKMSATKKRIGHDLKEFTLQEMAQSWIKMEQFGYWAVLNVSGHRISTTEVESALVSHEAVAEAAVVGAQDAMTGQGIVAFVILRGGIAHASGEQLVTELRNHVAKEIGAIAKPRQILVVAELPKTRSGKIMRRLLKDVAENRQVGDATTLADPNVMKLISEGLIIPMCL
jgi:acetyl-CoA synthetase